MAKIVKTDVQESALKMIKRNIKILEGINAVLNSSEEKCKLIMAAGNKKISLVIEKSLKDNMLKEIHKKLSMQTRALARKNAIALDAEDIAVIDNQMGEMLNRKTAENKEEYDKNEKGK